MAVNETSHPTLLDLAKRTAPDGNIDAIVELLGETNEILPEMSWQEGNLPTGHRTTVRTGLPEPTWRRLYGGVQPTKSTTAQITDTTGMLEAYAEVDKALADLNGNTNAFRLSEDRAHIEGMSQAVSETIFYGSEQVNPERFTGLAPRFSTADPAEANNAENVIDAGDTTGNLGSIWLIVWGDNTVHGIVPKGSTAGLQMNDKGQVTADAPDGGYYEAYRTHYRWDVGLTVRDWRYVVRIANIDRDSLANDPGTGDVILSDLMFEAIERIPNLSMGRAAFYMDRGMRTKVRQQTGRLVKNSTLTVEQLGGVPVQAFHGIPLRRVDSLAVDETAVPTA